MDEKHVASTSDHATSSWISSLFSRGPKPINARRAALLDRPEGRRSADLESLTSTDASTLLDAEQEPEKSSISARVISDAIIGLSDGLTVPFALTAGLSTLGNTRVVIFAGLAELTAGAISMGLGGYLGAKSEESVTPKPHPSVQIRSTDQTPQTEILTPHSSQQPHPSPLPPQRQPHPPSPQSWHPTSCPKLSSQTSQHTSRNPLTSPPSSCTSSTSPQRPRPRGH